MRLPVAQGPKVAQEYPNWGIQALYADRQLILQQKLTQYFVPFDSAIPDGSWRLFVFDDTRGETTVVLDDEATLIGRESFCAIQLTHRSVSRQHCVVQFRNVRLDLTDPQPKVVPYIFDIGSRYGTQINGEVIRSSCFVELKPRDRITIGTTVAAVLMRATPRVADEDDDESVVPPRQGNDK
jgi:pSer/pThr/pTyr-binding forkhead associated (FHA) protein